MQASVCAMCEGTIGSFMCSPCFAVEIGSSLPADLRGGFEILRGAIERAIPQGTAGLEHCAKCMRLVRAPLCLGCYAAEVHRWLLPKDEGSARTLLRLVPARPAAELLPVAQGQLSVVEH